MYTANNQVIFEEIYDENIQATEEEIAEYAIFLGIEPSDVILKKFLLFYSLFDLCSFEINSISRFEFN